MRAKRTWRPLAIKLMIGLGVASAAVAMQDQFPGVDRRGPSPARAQPSDPAPALPQPGHAIKGHTGPVSGVAFARRRRWIVSSRHRRHGEGLGRHTRAARPHPGRSTPGPATALAAEGQRAVRDTKMAPSSLWDLEAGDKLAAFKRNEAAISAVAFTGTQDRFAASAHDGTVTLFDVAARGGPSMCWRGTKRRAGARLFDGQRLAGVRRRRSHRQALERGRYSLDPDLPRSQREPSPRWR